MVGLRLILVGIWKKGLSSPCYECLDEEVVLRYNKNGSIYGEENGCEL